MYNCFLALAKIQTNYYRTNFFLLFLLSTAKPFHRSDDKEGSRSVAERFVVVIRTKPHPAHVQRSVVTFTVANIVTVALNQERHHPTDYPAHFPWLTHHITRKQLQLQHRSYSCFFIVSISFSYSILLSARRPFQN